MAVLVVVGLAAAWAQHDRSDDSAGRSSLPLIGLTLSGNDIAHFERIYDGLQSNNRVSPFYLENNRWAAGSAPIRRHGLQRAGEESRPGSGLPLGRA